MLRTVDDILRHVQRIRLGHHGRQRAVDAWVVAASFDGDDHLFANVRRLFGVGERRLGHLQLVVLEFSSHHGDFGRAWPQRRPQAALQLVRAVRQRQQQQV